MPALLVVAAPRITTKVSFFEKDERIFFRLFTLKRYLAFRYKTTRCDL